MTLRIVGICIVSLAWVNCENIREGSVSDKRGAEVDAEGEESLNELEHQFSEGQDDKTFGPAKLIDDHDDEAAEQPKCKESRKGLLYYSKSKSSFFYCSGGEWVAMDLTGPQGDVGEAGAKGTKGDSGATGSSGASGSQGTQGLQGDPGPSNFLKVYDNTDSAVGYFVTHLRIPDNGANTVNWHGFMMKSLSTDDLTAYKISKADSDTSGTGIAWVNDGAASQMKPMTYLQGGGASGTEVHYLNYDTTDCTGQAYIVREGENGPRPNYLSFAAYKGFYFDYGSGVDYTVTDIVSGVSADTDLFSYGLPGACTTYSHTGRALPVDVVDAIFPDILAKGWYIAP